MKTLDRLSRSTLIAFAGAASLASAAAADQNLFVGSPFGGVRAADSSNCVFAPVGVCGGPINSMSVTEGNLLLGDTNGNVYKVSTASGSPVSYYLTISGSDNTAMATDPATGDVFIANTSGTIRRVDASGQFGQVLATFTSPVQVDAIAVDDQRIYIGGPEGSVYAASKNSGTFTYFACICLGQIKSIAVKGDRIYAGDVNGTVQVYRKSDGQIVDGMWTQAPVAAMVFDGDDLLVADPTGAIRRFNAQTHALINTHPAGTTIAAMAIVETPVPPPCKADIDSNGQVSVQDVYTFLALWNFRHGLADFDSSGTIEVQDVYDYLGAWNTGCP